MKSLIQIMRSCWIQVGGIGLLFVYLGFLLWIKEKINIIHDYHYIKVKETDKKAYTRIMGIAMIIDYFKRILDCNTGILEAGKFKEIMQ